LILSKLLNNRYQVIDRLGGGGFSTTFLVEDTHMPSRRRCVLKQLKPVSVDPSIQTLVQERFQREAAILETLGELSDQIPRLYAYFTEAQQYYLVQELITGRTLSEIVQTQGSLREATVLNILLSLLPILDLIHQRGIIHRDIKPENIMVRDQDGKPVLIDFGAVKETLGTVVNAQGQPMSSVVIGTPGFMSTEQSRGFPTYASDLYSLGLTAIYLLTGKFPHELEIDPQTSQLRWHPEVLQVSPGLAAVLDRAIGLVARDRYGTAREFLQALHTQTTHSLSPQTPSAYPQVLPTPVGEPIYPLTVADPPREGLVPTNIASDSPTTFTPKKVGILSGIAVVSAVVSFIAVQQMWPLIEGLFAHRPVDPTPEPTETLPTVFPSDSPPVNPSPDVAVTPSPSIPIPSSPSPSPTALPEFAAIAYSVSTGAYGYGYRYPNRAGAEARAIQECNLRASDCQALFWFQNACGSLARATSGAYGWAWDAQIKKAESESLRLCKSYGGTDCQILLRLCADRLIS
jgi:serine/threonine-protein kinase